MPAASASRYAATWAEALEGMLDGDEAWGVLAQCRARLLLGAFDRDIDKPVEVLNKVQTLEV